jgi:hypothetical protein
MKFDLSKLKGSKDKPFPNHRRIILIILVCVIILCFVVFLSYITKGPHDYFYEGGYTKITVIQGQPSTFETGDGGYIFRYETNQSFILINGLIDTPFSSSQVFPTTEGSSYIAFQLEMNVSEVHSDYFVLVVKLLH